MSTNIQLNLARKWRSKHFGEIVGQELPVRMLKNSLYKDHYFPVYLFAGQRGCGKTSTARVFAAAINCEQLPEFQKQPRNCMLPCLQCSSCIAMMSGSHPDFIEMDAASHTGVDNVRNIIDASSLLPLMGRKKIYLIDEAHMLSKAAFNAFLKILEEPPASVLFILATTDTSKIIDTVKSRCFQLFFQPIKHDALLNHLQHICAQEKIVADTQALELIVAQSEGSARDALNILEQVRFSSSRLTKQSVLDVLGHIDEDRLIQLFITMLAHGPEQLLTFMKAEKISLYSAEFIWYRLIELARAALWVKHGVMPDQFTSSTEKIQRMIRSVSVQKLNKVLSSFYDQESVFLRTTAQSALLEMILLQLCSKNNAGNMSGTPAAATALAPDNESCADENEENDLEEEDFEEDDQDEEEEIINDEFAILWKQVVGMVKQQNDPLLTSVFAQGMYQSFSKDTNILEVEFSKQFEFFKDWLTESQSKWLPALQEKFGKKVQFNPQFTGAVAKVVRQPVPHVTIKKPEAKTQQSAYKNNNQYQKRSYNRKRPKPVLTKETVVDVSDVQAWQVANLLLKTFPGKITCVADIQLAVEQKKNSQLNNNNSKAKANTFTVTESQNVVLQQSTEHQGAYA